MSKFRLSSLNVLGGVAVRELEAGASHLLGYVSGGKKFFQTALLTAIVGLGAFSAQAADLAQIKEKGVINVVTEDNYAPFEMIVDGKPTGFNHDVIAEFVKYVPFKVKSEVMPWTGLLPSVLSGKYDVAITGAVVTPERLRAFDFAPPYASAQHYAIIRADDNDIKTVADLSGKTVGVQAGSALLTRLPELEAMLEKSGGKLGKVVQYTSYPEAYGDLANGRLDYVINAFVPAKSLTTKRGKIFKMSVPVSGPGFHAWPVPKNNPELLALMTSFMDELRSSGKLAELQEKWFGAAMPDLPKEPIVSTEQYVELTKPQ